MVSLFYSLVFVLSISTALSSDYHKKKVSLNGWESLEKQVHAGYKDLALCGVYCNLNKLFCDSFLLSEEGCSTANLVK